MAKTTGLHSAAVKLGKEGGKATKRKKVGIFDPKRKAAKKNATSKSGPVKVRKYKAKTAPKKKAAPKRKKAAAPRKKAVAKKKVAPKKKAAAPRKKATAKKRTAKARKPKQMKLF